MGMYYYMPWTPQKNDTNDEDDENGEDWLLSRITLKEMHPLLYN